MTLLLGFYVLIWPVLILGVLIVIGTAVLRDHRRAKREGNKVV